jgi:exopolyphosphatase / guanosine-5'-triphosphate,3'-diphosphate pyrophosphatase
LRVAVVDLGTNSTRLLVADVVGGRVEAELARESIVTRLGQGVDATGELAQEAIDRVFAVLDRYRRQIDDHAAEATVAVLTSAVRDAGNGDAFTRAVRDRYGLDARTIGGDEEAGLTFRGATSERPHADEPIVVIDIGGGSTEFVIGTTERISFHTSIQAGVVRMTERHLHTDPPTRNELTALVDDVDATLQSGIPQEHRTQPSTAIAVAGTATMAAAMELELEPYDPAKVHGQTVSLDALAARRNHLAALTNDERKQVRGLHPDRAPTIVAGVAMLHACVAAFDLKEVEVSEHDILRGAALQASERA